MLQQALQGGGANYGIYNNSSSTATIKNSSISATYSIINSTSTAKIAATMLEGPVAGSGYTCVGAYDENFAALDATCN